MSFENQSPEIEIKAPERVSALLGGLLIIVSIAGYAFYTRSLSTDVSAMQADIDTKNQRVSELTAQIATFQKAEEEFDLSTEVSKIETEKSVPLGVNQDDVIRDLISISDTYDVNLNSLSFGIGASASDEVGILRVNASFEGNYADLISFLEGIENNPYGRLFKVTSITVSISQFETSAIQRATFSLSMESYYQQQ
ncbi:MAG: hypothetical protein ABIH78_03215 [Candidatus Peregrinibacteria bacterium]